MQRGSIEKLIRGAYHAAVTAVLPQLIVPQYVKRNLDTLIVGEHTHILNKNVYMVGFGKAVINMVKPIEDILKIGDTDSHLVTGVVSVPWGITSSNEESVILPDNHSRVKIMEGALNNIPDQAARCATQKIVETIAYLQKEDLLLVLISGGGSALLPMPMSPITLEEKRTLVKLMGNAGADIVELNTVRKALSDVKGGNLAKKTKAKIISLILSDVINSPLDIIASGPTVCNPDDPRLALTLLKKYDLDIPSSVHMVLSNQEKTTTENCLSHVTNYIIGDNTTALSAAKEYVDNYNLENCHTVVVSSSLSGDAAEVGRAIADFSRLIIDGYITGKLNIPYSLMEVLHVTDAAGLSKTVQRCVSDKTALCLLFGGETTVRVTGSGVGGRNQEMALAAALTFKEHRPASCGGSWGFLSAGTDGIDGPTPAAGAAVTCTNGRSVFDYFSAEDGEEDHTASGSVVLRPADGEEDHTASGRLHLEDNDSYTFFRRLQDGHCLVQPGHTATNVMDIQIVFCAP